jgi:hypothetical protein
VYFRLGAEKSITLFYSVECHLIILFLAGNTSAFQLFFPDQDREMPGNPKIPKVFSSKEEFDQ